MRHETVLVTGGAGFIGSHLVDVLVSRGGRVHVVDDLSSGRAELVHPDATLHAMSITAKEQLDALFDEIGVGRVFHLGAQSSVTVSVRDPEHDCRVNVLGTLNVLEAAGRHRAPVTMTSTGGALYGNDAPIPTPEHSLPAPLAPYGASKAAGESYVRTWGAAHGLPHSVCRLGNVYGPRQSPHGEAGVVAIFSLKLSRGEAPDVFGHGRPTRDYVHVDDVVAALIAASGVAGTFNVATGHETDVATVLALLQKAAGTTLVPRLLPLRPGELNRSCMDPRRAETELGWRARVDVERGIPETYRALTEEFVRDRSA